MVDDEDEASVILYGAAQAVDGMPMEMVGPASMSNALNCPQVFSLTGAEEGSPTSENEENSYEEVGG